MHWPSFIGGMVVGWVLVIATGAFLLECAGRAVSDRYGRDMEGDPVEGARTRTIDRALVAHLQKQSAKDPR